MPTGRTVTAGRGPWAAAAPYRRAADRGARAEVPPAGMPRRRAADRGAPLPAAVLLPRNRQTLRNPKSCR